MRKVASGVDTSSPATCGLWTASGQREFLPVIANDEAPHSAPVADAGRMDLYWIAIFVALVHWYS